MRVSNSAERGRRQESLVAAFAQADPDRAGFIDQFSLGRSLMQSGVSLEKDDLTAIMASVPTSNNGQLVDYYAFAAAVAALTDPSRHAKLAVEAAVLDALRPYATDGGANSSTFTPMMMVVSSVALGQALEGGLLLTNESSITADLVHFAAAEARVERGASTTGTSNRGDDGGGAFVDCRRFARIVAGLDGDATQRRFGAAKKERREKVARDAGRSDCVPVRIDHYTVSLLILISLLGREP